MRKTNDVYSNTHNMVQVEGLALLKIIRHAHECIATDQEGSGILVGFQMNGVLEVTNTFPLPYDSENDPKYDENVVNYNDNMREKLGSMKGDYTQAGIYQIFLGESFINRGNFENLFHNQKTYPENVLIIYDPSTAMHGQYGLKAYRLAPDVLQEMLDNDQQVRIGGTSKMVSDGIWECESSANGRTSFMRLLQEVPIRVHNSHLCNLMLHDIVDSSDRIPKPSPIDMSINVTPQDITFSNTPELSSIGSLEHQLKALLSGLDKIHDMQYNYQRRLASIGKSSTNETRHRDLPPIKLEIGLYSANLNSICSNLSDMAGETVGKLMMTKAIHRLNK